MRFLVRFLHDAHGVTAVEFAVVAPVLLLTVMGIVEFALMMLAYNLMEGATVVSSRIGATGFAGAGISREETLRAAIAARAGALLNPANITITARAYSQFDQINDPEPFSDTNNNGVHDAGEPFSDINGNGVWDADMGRSGYGSSGDVVVYSASYPWRIVTPLLQNLIGEGGVYAITTHAVTKNEPF